MITAFRILVRTALLLSALSAGVANAGPGPGGGKGGDGPRKRCGGSVQVVLPDGSQKTFDPAADFLRGLPVRDIQQGESPRPAIKLDDILARLGARSVRVSDCHSAGQDLPTGLPLEGDVYMVLTGRGLLKFVREVQPGRFVNLIQNIHSLRFRGDAGHATQPPGRSR
ncbi:MAG TPA: hypothetical protein VM240_08355 [Verrucomicrobiae bacterium]|nr:hypothetical protein [Verrucomicrobiae bacterium]